MGSATGRRPKGVKTAKRPRDHYPTPLEALDALADLVPTFYRGGPVLEPGVGDGRVIRWLRRVVPDAGPACGVDLPERHADPGDREILAASGIHLIPADFLTWEGPPHARFRLVLGNPPYGEALPFVRRSLELIDRAGAVAFLLRIGFLGSQARRTFWSDTPLSHVRVLSKRPKFVNGRSDATEYAWFVWRPTHDGPATIDVR